MVTIHVYDYVHSILSFVQFLPKDRLSASEITERLKDVQQLKFHKCIATYVILNFQYFIRNNNVVDYTTVAVLGLQIQSFKFHLFTN